jgi:hypothetical protein
VSDQTFRRCLPAVFLSCFIIGMSKQTRASASPAEPSPAAALAELIATVYELRASDVPLWKRQVELEQRLGSSNRTPPSKPEATRAAAYALLNGSAAPLAANGAPSPFVELEQIVLKRAAIKDALEIGSQLGAELERKVRAELSEQRKDEISALMKQRTLAVVGLERIEQALDAAIKGTDFQGYALPLGRLRHSHQPMYRFLEQMVARGHLSASDFEAEVKRARKAAE